MPQKVEILSQREVYKHNFIRMEEATFRHELFDGSMTEPMTRVALMRGDSTAVIVHNRTDDTLIMTEQFRYPSYTQGQGWLLEFPAGSIPSGESPEATARREVEEEIGFRVAELKHVSTFYVSPGATSERIHLYYAQVSSADKVSEGGGRKSESEYIRVHHIKLADALAKLDSGDICDAKTIIGLQWLKLRGQPDPSQA